MLLYKVSQEILLMCYLGFSGPLKPELVKKYDEQFALLILQHCFKSDYGNYILSDAPDLQCVDGTTGIEVTSAILECDAKIDGEFARYRLGPKKETDQKRCERIIERNGGRFEEFGISYPPKTCADELRIFQEAIHKKTNKIQSYQKNGFTQIGLFVLYEEMPIPHSVQMLIKQLDSLQNGCDEQYDFFFLCYPYGIIRFEQKSKQYEIFSIGQVDYERLSIEARIAIEK